MDVFIDDDRVGKLKDGRLLCLDLEPGDHHIALREGDLSKRMKTAVALTTPIILLPMAADSGYQGKRSAGDKFVHVEQGEISVVQARFRLLPESIELVVQDPEWLSETSLSPAKPEDRLMADLSVIDGLNDDDEEEAAEEESPTAQNPGASRMPGNSPTETREP